VGSGSGAGLVAADHGDQMDVGAGGEDLGLMQSPPGSCADHGHPGGRSGGGRGGRDDGGRETRGGDHRFSMDAPGMAVEI
jgi:hypothetical protein